MARENKRKRDERRFGRPERLADKIRVLPRGIPVSFTDNTRSPSKEVGRRWLKNVDLILEEASAAPVVQADNVTEYFRGTFGSRGFDWLKDLPTAMPPFDSIFIESSIADQALPGYPSDMAMPNSWGLIIHKFTPDGVPCSGATAEYFNSWVGTRPPECAYLLHATLVEDDVGFIDAGRLAVGFMIDRSGRVLGEPSFCGVFRERARAEYSDREISRLKALAAPLFLAISFLNCKNVTLSAVEPDKALNRERKKAKLKPFVRYHTINIEPMKKVLRTEGQIETQGLKKALHICRGHFSTYTEEKPLFGKVAGTFWVPAHVRGALKEGVVVSDYKVSPPRKDGP